MTPVKLKFSYPLICHLAISAGMSASSIIPSSVVLLKTDCIFLQVVAVSPELQVTGEVTKATSFTSDLIELVSGVCPVNLSSMPVS